MKQHWRVALTGLWLVFGTVGVAQIQPEAQALIDKAIAAHGGRAAIAGIKTMTRLELGSNLVDGQTSKLGYRELYDFAGQRFRSESIGAGYPFAVRQIAPNQSVRWTVDKGSETVSFKTNGLEDELLHFLLQPLRKAEVLGPRTVFGVSGLALLLVSQGGLSIFCYLLGSDGTILARTSDADFYPTASIDFFSDYREVNGVRLSFGFRKLTNAVVVQDFQALEVKINPNLAEDAFKLPPPQPPAGRVGLSYEATAAGFKLTVITENGPAAKAGLQVGDVILEVGGISLADWNELKPNPIRGEPGSTVVLTVKRGEQTLKISVTRAVF